MTRSVADCGSCSACCYLMAVPSLNKPACIWCEHASRPHGGCTIYNQPEKPQECDDFMCLWRASQERSIGDRMPYELRPDRSKVMFHDALAVYPVDHDVPVDDQNIMYVHVFPEHPGAWLNPAAKAHIDMVLARGCKVHVIIGPRRIKLEGGNPPLSTDDGAAVRTALRTIS